MKVRTILSVLMLLPLFCSIAVPARAQTGNAQDMLNQYVTNLQSNPSDTALREKIIALTLTMDPPPEVSAEARRHMARGVAAVEDAKSADDFKDACNEFQQATTLAPWLANGYRNLAIAQDKAGMYDEALTSLRLYLLTRPSSTDADWAEDLKSKVEYRKERIAKAKEEENSPQAVAAREQKSFEDLLKKIDGRRYSFKYPSDMAIVFVIDINGRFLTEGQIWPPDTGPNQLVHPGYNKGGIHVEIQGRVTNFSYSTQFQSELIRIELRYTISEDGDTITWHRTSNSSRFPDEEHVYEWQR
jgi:tetratricopeptide (TPR) repeat protein